MTGFIRVDCVAAYSCPSWNQHQEEEIVLAQLLMKELVIPGAAIPCREMWPSNTLKKAVKQHT